MAKQWRMLAVLKLPKFNVCATLSRSFRLYKRKISTRPDVSREKVVAFFPQSVSLFAIFHTDFVIECVLMRQRYTQEKSIYRMWQKKTGEKSTERQKQKLNHLCIERKRSTMKLWKTKDSVFTFTVFCVWNSPKPRTYLIIFRYDEHFPCHTL